MFIKISNLTNASGACDYKGLDLSLIVPGTQYYPVGENVAYFDYTGEMIAHPDVTEATIAEIDEAKARDAANIPISEVEQLRADVAAQGEAINFLLGV